MHKQGDWVNAGTGQCGVCGQFIEMFQIAGPGGNLAGAKLKFYEHDGVKRIQSQGNMITVSNKIKCPGSGE